MCGIIGRVSLKNNCVKTLDGLKNLEYRGYDSFGILLHNIDSGKIVLEKDVGAIDDDRYRLLSDLKSNVEIGHTRWATHGGIAKENAHPHFDINREFFVVMNGIVENYLEVKKMLLERGYCFCSQTDTEVIAHFFSYYFEERDDLENSLIDTLKKVVRNLKGEFSFLIKYKNYVLGYKNINPLIVGLCDDEVFISSDLRIVSSSCDFYHILDDYESFISCCSEDEVGLKFFDKNFEVFEKEQIESCFLEEEVLKDTKYFMEKEILDQKYILRIFTSQNFASLRYLYEQFNSGKRIILTGAGTSYHAGMYMRYVLLEMGIYSDVVLASELKNYLGVLNESLIVVFSQSGETADLIYPLRELDSCEIFCITNTKDSTLDRMASRSCYLNCGREIGVASTKAFLFAMFVSKILQSFHLNYDIELEAKSFVLEFDKFILESRSKIEDICNLYYGEKGFFFIGRRINYPLALEGALKLKEISYIHAEGFAGGELKHGSLALIEDGVPVIVLGVDSEILSNATEVKSRGGVIIGISKSYNEVYDYFFRVPDKFEDLFGVILMQFFAFEMALVLGYNPDKPRNLAKSVTVK